MATEAAIRITAQDTTSAAFASAQKNLGALGAQTSRLTNLLGSLGASLSVSIVTGWFKAIVDGVDALNDLKDATGGSIENLSALEDVGLRTGTSFETISSGLVKFNAVLKDAKPGTDAAEAIKALGLNVEELKRLDPAEALRRTAVALAGFADDGNKARLVQELLGKSTRELSAFLKDLGEQGKLNATVTTAQAEAAEKFNNQLAALQKNSTDAARALTSDLVIGINNAAAAMRESGLLQAFRVLITGNDQFKNDKALFEQTDEKLRLEKEIQQLETSGIALEAAQARKKRERLKILEDELKLTLAYRKVLQGEASAGSKPDTRPSAPASLGATKKPAAEVKQTHDAVAAYIVTLEKQLEREIELSQVEQTRNELVRLGAQGRSEQQRAIEAASKIDQAKAEEALARAREKSNEALLRSLADQIRDNDAKVLSNKTLGEQLEEMGLTTAALEALRLKRLDETIAQEQQTLAIMRSSGQAEAELLLMERRIELLQQERDITAKTGEKRIAIAAETESEEFAKSLNSDVKSALSNAFRDSKDPAQAFANALGNIVFTRLTNAAGSALADVLVGTGKPGGDYGLIGGLFKMIGLSFEGGGSTGSGPRAGGLDGKGGFLGMLHPRETVVDHTRGQSTGFAPQTTINVAGGVTKGELIATVRQALDANNRAWSEQLRQSGAIG